MVSREGIKMARIERGISKQQLARDAGLHQSHLSMIESDKHDPSATIVRTLAGAPGECELSTRVVE